MSNVIPLRSTAPPTPEVVSESEHACTRQARILHAWLLDTVDDPDVGPDWAIAKLKTAIEIAEVRRVFKKL